MPKIIRSYLDYKSGDFMDKAKTIEHIKAHVGYPATRDQLVQACNNMSEFSAEDKAWFAKALPKGTFKTANDVIKALRM